MLLPSPLKFSNVPGYVRAGGVLLALWLGSWTSPFLRASDLYVARVDELHDTYVGIGTEMANQWNAARAELDTLPEGGEWTDEAKAAARSWLNGLIQPRFPAGAAQRPESLHPARQYQVLLKAGQFPNLPGPALAFARKVSTRFQALRELRQEVWSDYTYAVAQAAEDVWLDATKPEDLAPALRILDRFKSVDLDPAPATDPNRVERPFPTSATKVGGYEVRMSDDDALAALVLMSGPDPLILPDPLVDPARYRMMRIRWHNLGGWHLRFCERWLVSQKIRDFDHRYRLMAERSRRELDRLIVNEAPAAEILAAMARLDSFRNDNPMNPPLPIPVPGRPFTPPTPAPAPETKLHESALTFPGDYRALLDEIGGERPGSVMESGYFRPAIDSTVIDSYHTLLKALGIDTTGQPFDASKLAGPMLYRYPNPIRERLLTRYNLDMFGRPQSTTRQAVTKAVVPELKSVPAPPTDKPAFEAVLISLQGAAGAEAAFSPAAQFLAPLWKSLHAPAAGEPATSNAAQYWQALAAEPGGPVLLAARDRAVLALLATSQSDVPEEPALRALRRRWEESLRAGDVATSRRILQIDRATGLLPQEEQEQCSELLSILASGKQPQKGSEAVARMRLPNLLTRVQDPATVTAILQRVKTPQKP